MKLQAIVVGVGLAVLPSAALAQQDEGLRALVASAATAESQLYPVGERSRNFTAYDVAIDSVGVIGNYTLWRATVESVDHWHWYQMATLGERTIKLGGFQSPALAEIASVACDPGFIRSAVVECSKLLARIADPERGGGGVFPGALGATTTPDTVLRQWTRLAPTGWPVDTVLDLSAGRLLVRVTFLAERTRAMTAVWVPSVYVFIYEQEKGLIDWARYTSKGFGLRQNRR
jgi:hypothetical protein